MRKIYKQMIVGSIFLTTAFVCFFILQSTRSSALQKEIHSWIGYQMNFPEGVRLISGDSALLNKPYKILMYIDDMGCTGCNLKLQEWSDMYETGFNTEIQDDLSVIILFEGSKKEDILMYVESANWEMPVLWDRDGAISRRRQFSKQVRMRCMLLDKDNKVALMGNPFYSHSVYDLYLKFFLNQTNYLQTTKN